MSGLAGRLRERIVVMRRADDRDALAATDGAWTPLAARWAAVTAEGTGEAVSGEATSAAPRFVVTLRAGIAVLPGDRIEWDGQALTVRSVAVDPVRPERIVLKAEAVR